MKKLLIAASVLFNTGVMAGPYDTNSFGMMPHKKIMELNIDKCKIDANATGDTSKLHNCIAYQQKAFEQLLVIYNEKSITAPSWSLCIGQARSGYAYNYVIMYGCMKVVKDICKEKSDGQWVDPNLCIRSIESGAWIRNPKVYEPYQSSKKTLDLSSDDQAP